MEIYLIRHGKTQGNLEQRYIGSTDQPLCPQGREELLRRQEQGLYPKGIEALASSPLLRCQETARLLYPKLEPTLIPQLRESSFGRYELKSWRELEQDEAYQQWLASGGSLPFPDGESKEALTARCLPAFRQLLAQWQRQGIAKAVLVVHGGTIMALLSTLCGGDFYRWQVPNGGLCRLRVEGESYQGEILD